MAVLKTEKLSKNYGALAALRGVDLEVAEHSIFGLLGPNGSGKTTFLGIVLGCLAPTQGKFEWQNDRKRGCLLETPNFYPYLCGADNLEIVAQIRGCNPQEIPSILELVGLQAHPNLAFGKYSLGMKQRLAIGSALLGSPEVVVLDEPTNGLDPAGIADVRELIRQVAKSGRTVILASHLLDEVEKVCTHLAILRQGKVLAQGPMQDVLRDEDTIEVHSSDLEKLEQLLRQHPENLKVVPAEKGLAVRFAAGSFNTERLNRYLVEKGLYLDHLVLRKKTLESRFLELTDQ